MSCVNPELVCRYYDYNYSDEGFILFNYGIEGESFYYDETAYYQFQLAQRTASTEISESNIYTESYADTYMIPNAVSIGADRTAEYASIVNEIVTYANEWITLYIRGENDLSGYNTFLDTVERMGLPTLIQWKQEAYDEFLSR